MPTSAAPATSHVELTLKRTSSTSAARAMAIVSGSTNDALPNCQVTAAIRPSEATLTPSSSAPTHGERRMRGMRGPEAATNTNEGRKMPTVAMSAPRTPPST